MGLITFKMVVVQTTQMICVLLGPRNVLNGFPLLPAAYQFYQSYRAGGIRRAAVTGTGTAHDPLGLFT